MVSLGPSDRVLITGGSGFIGTHLIEALLVLGCSIRNLDVQAPKLKEHRHLWSAIDLKCSDRLLSELESFDPNIVVHLAARTDTDGVGIDDYADNIQGTKNVLNAINGRESVDYLVLTSTQFVNQSPEAPMHDQDFAPHTVYGESKVITEVLLRELDGSFNWTIIRPTNVWGAWHPRYAQEFWRVLASGLYLHPSKKDVVRSYGYVGNVVHQIIALIDLDRDAKHGRVVYVGDEPIPQRRWVDEFSLAICGHGVRVVPTLVIRVVGLFGDLLARLGVKFPLTTSRVRSMTTSNALSMEPTFTLLGSPKYSLEEGVKETVTWLREYHPDLFK